MLSSDCHRSSFLSVCVHIILFCLSNHQLCSLASQPLCCSVGCCPETHKGPMGKMLSVSSTRCPHLRPAQGLFLQALHIFPELSTNLVGSSAPYSSSRLILGRFILIFRSPRLRVLSTPESNMIHGELSQLLPHLQ